MYRAQTLRSHARRCSRIQGGRLLPGKDLSFHWSLKRLRRARGESTLRDVEFDRLSGSRSFLAQLSSSLRSLSRSV